MTQATRSEFAYSGYQVHFIPRQGMMRLATGGEAPVPSPAQELQKALDEMFSGSVAVKPNYQRAAALSVVTAMVVAGCSAFWWIAIHWAASFVSQ